ncbi:hypothetical protein ACTXT7_004457 [Hymenolepis weldensis]
MTPQFGKRSILVGAGFNILLLTGALAAGLYLIVTECTYEDNYNNLCKLGAALTWLGTLAFVGLTFFTFFGYIIVKMEKEIEDLTTKNNLLSNSGHAVTSSAARVSAKTSDSEKHLVSTFKVAT